MNKRIPFVVLLSLAFLSLTAFGGEAAAGAQKTPAKAAVSQEHPVAVMTQSMTDRLAKNLHVKNIVGDPVKIGGMTIIPVIMLDMGYGGGEGGPPAQKAGGFYMNGEARPLGFILITKKGVKFISVGKAPRK